MNFLDTLENLVNQTAFMSLTGQLYNDCRCLCFPIFSNKERI